MLVESEFVLCIRNPGTYWTYVLYLFLCPEYNVLAQGSLLCHNLPRLKCQASDRCSSRVGPVGGAVVGAFCEHMVLHSQNGGPNNKVISQSWAVSVLHMFNQLLWFNSFENNRKRSVTVYSVPISVFPNYTRLYYTRALDGLAPWRADGHAACPARKTIIINIIIIISVVSLLVWLYDGMMCLMLCWYLCDISLTLI